MCLSLREENISAVFYRYLQKFLFKVKWRGNKAVSTEITQLVFDISVMEDDYP